MRRMWTPTGFHYLSLPVALIAILLLARDQWFFGDDWAILAPSKDGAVLSPHVGHLNMVPALLFPALRDVFGLGSYVPFLLTALIAHLAVAHLLWRICLRTGATPWIATTLSIVVLFLGGGAENILWAFQFGFMGAIAIGLLVILLLDSPRLTPVIGLLAAVAAAAAPLFSGTAIPALAAAAIVGYRRHGVLRSIAVLAPSALLYLVWYLTIGRNSPTPATGIQTLVEVGTAILFAGVMYGGGLGRALPWIGLGVLPALAVAVWFARSLRRGLEPRATMAYAMLFGSVTFVLLTTWSRYSFGVTAAATPRYAYFVVVLLLPAFALMLSSLEQRSDRWRIVVFSVVGCLAITNLVVLSLDAQAQSVREQASRVRVLDTLERLIAHPDDFGLLSQPADPQWATDLLGSDLLELYLRGEIAPQG